MATIMAKIRIHRRSCEKWSSSGEESSFFLFCWLFGGVKVIFCCPLVRFAFLFDLFSFLSGGVPLPILFFHVEPIVQRVHSVSATTGLLTQFCQGGASGPGRR